MQKVAKYVIFETKWGYFGLAGAESALCRTCLPGPKRRKTETHLLRDLSGAQFDKTFFKSLQEQIAAYYEGACIDFDPEIPVSLDGFRAFGACCYKKGRMYHGKIKIVYNFVVTCIIARLLDDYSKL